MLHRGVTNTSNFDNSASVVSLKASCTSARRQREDASICSFELGKGSPCEAQLGHEGTRWWMHVLLALGARVQSPCATWAQQQPLPPQNPAHSTLGKAVEYSMAKFASA